jgi:hypothetical protein
LLTNAKQNKKTTITKHNYYFIREEMKLLALQHFLCCWVMRMGRSLCGEEANGGWSKKTLSLSLSPSM